MSHELTNTSGSELELIEDFGNATTSRCIWCKEEKVLVSGAKYCETCYAKCYKVCIRCKIPYPESKYFDESDTDRCNSCYRKYVKEREKRLEKLHQTSVQQKTSTVRKRPPPPPPSTPLKRPPPPPPPRHLRSLQSLLFHLFLLLLMMMMMMLTMW